MADVWKSTANSLRLTTGRGLLGLALLTGLVCANCLGGGYFLDDETIYLEDSRVLRGTLKSAFSSNLPSFIPTTHGYY